MEQNIVKWKNLSFYSDLFIMNSELLRKKKISWIKRLKCHSFAIWTAYACINGLTMLFTFNCIFHNPSTYSIGQLFKFEHLLKETLARIYDTNVYALLQSGSLLVTVSTGNIHCIHCGARACLFFLSHFAWNQL